MSRLYANEPSPQAGDGMSKQAGERFLDTLDTQAPLTGSVPEAPEGVQENGTDSPSAVREHEIALTLRLTQINQSLPGWERDVKDALAHIREMKAERTEIERLLRAHKRLREPIRRKK